MFVNVSQLSHLTAMMSFEPIKLRNLKSVDIRFCFFVALTRDGTFIKTHSTERRGVNGKHAVCRCVRVRAFQARNVIGWDSKRVDP